MDIAEVWTMFQDVRGVVEEMREKYDRPDMPPNHWLQVMAREVGQAGEEALGEEEADMMEIAYRVLAIGFCFVVDINRESGRRRRTARESAGRISGGQNGS